VIVGNGPVKNLLTAKAQSTQRILTLSALGVSEAGGEKLKYGN